ncbi:MAG: NAD(P)H-dependent oxidoreductase [Pseudomonadota bacterium]
MTDSATAKTVLIVLAHPDNRSFNGSWAAASAGAAAALGHRVLYSDLCAMNFDAVESARHYHTHSADQVFDPLKAQEHCTAESLPLVVAAEIDKVQAADWIIFHFPLWWFAPPAVLKGWFDRVFVHGQLHTVEQRFDHGLCADKKALCCVSTGANKPECAFHGKEGDIQMLLWPTAYTLRYLGFSVLEHEVIHGVHGYFEEHEQQRLESRLQATLQQQKSLISQFDTRPALPFNADTDFDEYGRLKNTSPTLSPFIRHSK